jgi:hypothetical protein
VLTTFRDPRYFGPFAALIGVIVLSAVLAGRSGGASAAPSAATATAAPRVARTPGADEILLDSRRFIDLNKLADTLKTLRQKDGAYPATDGVYKPICFAVGDPTCVLASLAGKVPASDGQYAYYYRSDGATFTLVAHTQVWPQQDNCPADVPAAFDGGPVLCVTDATGGAR